VEVHIFQTNPIGAGSVGSLLVLYNLVGGLEHFLFSPIVGMMIQSDFLIFRGVKPPISNPPQLGQVESDLETLLKNKSHG